MSYYFFFSIKKRGKTPRFLFIVIYQTFSSTYMFCYIEVYSFSRISLFILHLLYGEVTGIYILPLLKHRFAFGEFSFFLRHKSPVTSKLTIYQ